MIASCLLLLVQAPDPARVLQHSPLPPLAPNPTNAVADDPRAARLGEQLFSDTGLSANGRISFALAEVVSIFSFLSNEVTSIRSSALRCPEFLPNCLPAHPCLIVLSLPK